MTDEHDKKSSVDASSAPGQPTAPDSSAPASAAPRRGTSDTDPLAELIRMVKEEDPFADVLARKSGPLSQRVTPKAEGATPATATTPPSATTSPATTSAATMSGETREPAMPPAPERPRETTAVPRPFATESRPDPASGRFTAFQEPKEPSLPLASSDDVLAGRQGEPEQNRPSGAVRVSPGLSLGLRRGNSTDKEIGGDKTSDDAPSLKDSGGEAVSSAGTAIPPVAGEPSAEEAPARLRSWMKPSESAGRTAASAAGESASPAPAPRAATEFAPSAPSTSEPVSAPQSIVEDPYEPPALDPVDLERALRDFRDAPEHVLRADTGWHDDGFEEDLGDGDDLRSAGETPAVPPPAYSTAPAPSAPAPSYGEPEVSAEPFSEAVPAAHGEFDPVDPYDDPAFDDFNEDGYQAEAGEDPYQGAPAEPYLSEEVIEEAVDERVGAQGTLGQAVAFEHAARHEPKPRRRGTFFAVGILLGLVVLGGGFAYIMSGDTAPVEGEAPILRADNTPAKIEPDDPGGANIPNQNRLVFDRVSGETSGGKEQIVSREEEIIEPAGGTKQTGRMGESDSGDAGAAPASQASGQQAALSPNGSSTGLPLAPVPRRVKTMVVRPDGTIVAAEEPEPMPSTSEPAATPEPAASAPAPVPQASTTANAPAPGEKTAERAISALGNGAIPAPPSRPEDAPASVSSASGGTASAVTPVRPVRGAPMPLNPNPVTRRAADNGSSAAAAPQPEPAASNVSRQVASATPRAAPEPSPSGQYVVQLAARKNEEQARGAYDALKAKYRNLLGRYQPLIQRADLGDRGVYYRVRVGPMATADAAGELCDQLKAAGLSDCLVRQR